MLRLAFDFIITWRETRTRPNAYVVCTCVQLNQLSILLMYLDEEECYKVILPVVCCAGYKVMYMSGLLGKV